MSDPSDVNLFEAMLTDGAASPCGLVEEGDNGALRRRGKCQSTTASGDASADIIQL